MELLYKWAVLSAVLLVAAAALPNVKIKSPFAAVFGAAVFGVMNVICGWFLETIMGMILFLPRILTFGLLGVLVPIGVNMILLKMATGATDGDIEIDGLAGLAALSAIVSATAAVAF
ncbi:MAG: phage holin family protein [Myxococcota bacterium]|nr:phage holin family protein [Myxococcota bacterium]